MVVCMYEDDIGEKTYKKLAGIVQYILCSLYHALMQKWNKYSVRFTLKNQNEKQNVCRTGKCYFEYQDWIE